MPFTTILELSVSSYLILAHFNSFSGAVLIVRVMLAMLVKIERKTDKFIEKKVSSRLGTQKLSLLYG